MGPCEKCGAKPGRGGVILKHKKGCGDVHVVNLHPELRLSCCNHPMSRTNGGSQDVMCRHSRLLTDDCKQCRQDHHGVLIYQCKVCGRQVQDAPHLAQGNEAFIANNQAR